MEKLSHVSHVSKLPASRRESPAGRAGVLLSTENGRILLANPKVPQMCLAYAVIEGPGTWGIQSSNRSPVA